MLSRIIVKFLDFSSTVNQINQVKVLCWILTSPSNHFKRAAHVKRSWGSRCDKLIFISTKEDANLGAIKVNVTEGRKPLWGKTKAGLKYIYDNFLNEYEWFLKADDDTYVSVYGFLISC